MNQLEFIKKFITDRGMSEEEYVKLNISALPCSCDNQFCTGWRLVENSMIVDYLCSYHRDILMNFKLAPIDKGIE